jgi:hypothetical protein
VLLLASCGDDDPSTSSECKRARETYIMAKAMLDRANSLGFPASYVELDKFKSDHWECFK